MTAVCPKSPNASRALPNDSQHQSVSRSNSDLTSCLYTDVLQHYHLLGLLGLLFHDWLVDHTLRIVDDGRVSALPMDEHRLREIIWGATLDVHVQIS